MKNIHRRKSKFWQVVTRVRYIKQLNYFLQLSSLKTKILPQIQIKAFKLKVEESFERYLNLLPKIRNLLINMIFLAFNSRFLSDPNQKIAKKDEYEKFIFYNKKH